MSESHPDQEAPDEDIRLVAMTRADAERFREFTERCESGASYYAEHHCAEAAAESAAEADLFRRLATAYESGITADDAQLISVALLDAGYDPDDDPQDWDDRLAIAKFRSAFRSPPR